MGAGGEGYTNLWSTLKGWELEEKGTQTCGCTPQVCVPFSSSSHPFNVLHKFVYPSLPAPIPLMYIKGMGAGGEGYTNLWSTLRGWELEEKGTQTCGVH
jgi:hypothetical protein